MVPSRSPAVQHLKALGKELSFPRIDRLRSILRAGWGLVTEVGRGGRTAVFTDRLEELILVVPTRGSRRCSSP